MNKDLMLFAKKLKQIRKQRHLTLEKFSELVDISPNHISKLESARTFPSFQLISRIANALNIDIKELFDFDGDKDEEYIKNEFVQMIKHSNPKYLNTLYKIHQNLTEL